MRRRQFLQLVNDLKAEIGQDNSVGSRAANLPTLKQVINRCYEAAYDESDWPFLQVVAARITLSAGERYYDFPATIDYDKIESVALWQGNTPLPIERGISFEEYASYDSNEDVRSDPVAKWDIRYDTADQFEVWPIPASNTQTIQFIGRRKFTPLVNDSDLCLVDDALVILPAAVELLSGSNNAGAAAKAAAAQRRLDKVRGRAAVERPTVRLGLGVQGRDPNPRSTVRIAGR